MKVFQAPIREKRVRKVRKIKRGGGGRDEERGFVYADYFRYESSNREIWSYKYGIMEGGGRVQVFVEIELWSFFSFLGIETNSSTGRDAINILHRCK